MGDRRAQRALDPGAAAVEVHRLDDDAADLLAVVEELAPESDLHAALLARPDQHGHRVPAVAHGLEHGRGMRLELRRLGLLRGWGRRVECQLHVEVEGLPVRVRYDADQVAVRLEFASHADVCLPFVRSAPQGPDSSRIHQHDGVAQRGRNRRGVDPDREVPGLAQPGAEPALAILAGAVQLVPPHVRGIHVQRTRRVSVGRAGERARREQPRDRTRAEQASQVLGGAHQPPNELGGGRCTMRAISPPLSMRYFAWTRMPSRFLIVHCKIPPPRRCPCCRNVGSARGPLHSRIS